MEWEVRHIYREFNQTADALANAALDDENGNGPSKHWYRSGERNTKTDEKIVKTERKQTIKEMKEIQVEEHQRKKEKTDQKENK